MEQEHEMVEDRRIERVLSLLLPQEGGLVNVKFCRGDRPHITLDEFCNEVHSAFFQRRLGTASLSKVFAEDARTVDVREFVASL